MEEIKWMPYKEYLIQKDFLSRTGTNDNNENAIFFI